jgi:hypothetical protein
MREDVGLARTKKGYAKLEGSCRIAMQHGYQFIWADTVCIDKSSSAELSEAINSMYEYYAKSQLCIAYLDDVEDVSQNDTYLDKSAWFTRGWTLQELIAPINMIFYSTGWKELGKKIRLSREINKACGVNEHILIGASLDTICISEKMSWASQRTTTRPEDRAYSLMVSPYCRRANRTLTSPVFFRDCSASICRHCKYTSVLNAAPYRSNNAQIWRRSRKSFPQAAARDTPNDNRSDVICMGVRDYNG